jgi:hypothetical protein
MLYDLCANAVLESDATFAMLRFFCLCCYTDAVLSAVLCACFNNCYNAALCCAMLVLCFDGTMML